MHHMKKANIASVLDYFKHASPEVGKRVATAATDGTALDLSLTDIQDVRDRRWFFGERAGQDI